MVAKLITSALVFHALVAFAPSAHAQVETSAVTDESRSTPPAHEDPPLPPRRDPVLYGAGLGTTIVGSVAVPVGLMVIVAGFAESVGQAACFDASCRQASHDGTTTIGLSVLTGGLVMLAVGIPMLVVGSKREARTTAGSPFVVRF
jgi:hypothetical protein